MATPHLTYRAKDEETTNPLLRTVDSNGKGHLLIIRRASAWSNKELVVTPDAEYYSCAVVHGKSSQYLNQLPYSDSVALTNAHEAAWTALDETAWKEGHKPSFNYVARGFGPWYVRTCASSVTESTASQIMEYGGSRQNLHFNCRAIPWMIGTATGQTLDAYLRFWNPSSVGCGFQQELGRNWFDYEEARGSTSESTLQPINSGVAEISRAYSTIANRAFYVFNEEGGKAPNEFASESPNSCNFYGFANEGKKDQTNCWVLRYDPWNIHHYSSASATVQANVHTAIYALGTYGNSNNFSSSPYYADHKITGTQLDRLKKCIRDTGGAWMQIGFRPFVVCANASSGQTLNLYATCMAYFSRVELVFKATGAAANK